MASDDNGLKVIVGLGNPGSRYSATRHNAGYRVLDLFGTETGASFENKDRLFCQLGKTIFAGRPVILVKPTTYMNLSGRAFVAVKQWFKVDDRDFLVIHDDVSLPLGRLRFQKGGGAGGQHGIESIIECTGGGRGFDRLKFGVGPDPGGDRRADYVLSCVPQSDLELLAKSEKLAVDGVKAWLKTGMAATMNRFNGIDLVPKPPKPETAAPAETNSKDCIDGCISSVDADQQSEVK